MKMIKEQVLILKVRYDDAQNQTPHTWDWSSIVDNGQEVEVMNHGAAVPSKSTT